MYRRQNSCGVYICARLLTAYNTGKDTSCVMSSLFMHGTSDGPVNNGKEKKVN